MLKVSHITIKKQQRHLVSGVSFTLATHGFTALCASEKESEKALALVLAGNLTPNEGTLQCDEVVLDTFDVASMAQYRKCCATSWFGDFLLLETKSVKENVTLQYSYDRAAVQQVLTWWQLDNLQEQDIESQPFAIKVAVILARIMLHGNRVLVFYPDSTPFSKEERSCIYQLLKKCSEQLQVVVIGDSTCYGYADRVLEFREGKLISDNGVDDLLQEEETTIDHPLPISAWKTLFQTQHHRYRLPYHALKVLVLMSLLLICILWSTTSLDTVNIEMGMLQKNGYSTFAVEKLTYGDDGTLYPGQYSSMEEKDVTLLEEALEGKLLCSYMPVNTSSANAYLEGIYEENSYPLHNALPLIEAANAKEAGIDHMVGSYPKTYDEVALSFSSAKRLLNRSAKDEEELLGAIIGWYGLPLKITGIFTDDNKNLQVQAQEAAGQKSSALYVKTGYLKQHPLSQMKTFPSSYKRMLHQNQFLSLEDIEPVEVFSRYYNGEQVLYQTQAEDGEVVLDMAAAIALGFPYENYTMDETMSYQEKLLHYLAFANEWIHENLQVQAYTIETAPLNSMIYQKEVTIGGFLIPSMDQLDGKVEIKKPILYMKEEALKDMLSVNLQVQDVYFHGNTPEELRGALQYLKTSKQYEATLENALLLQLIVVDFKDLFHFFSIASIVYLVSSIFLYFLLLHKTMEHLRTECSIYYIFGEQKAILRKQFEQEFLRRLRKYLIASMVLTTLVLWGYILLILLQLSADAALLFYLILPACVALLIYFSMQLATMLYLKRTQLLVDVYEEEL